MLNFGVLKGTGVATSPLGNRLLVVYVLVRKSGTTFLLNVRPVAEKYLLPWPSVPLTISDEVNIR